MLHRSLDASQVVGCFTGRWMLHRVVVRLRPSCLFIVVQPLYIKDYDEGGRMRWPYPCK